MNSQIKDIQQNNLTHFIKYLTISETKGNREIKALKAKANQKHVE